jgi:hypothetical protein
MKHLARLCLIVALSVSANANATISLENGSAYSKVVNVDSGFDFIHTYNFHLDFTGPALISTSAQELKLGNLIDIDWANNDAFVVKDSSSKVLYSAGEDDKLIGNFAFDGLPLGTQDFSVALHGESIGKLDPAGMYMISVVAAAVPVPLPASPVPEPASTALLLGGLGLIGVISRRRAGR